MFCIDAMPTRKLRFAVDSPVEGAGFEPSVPLRRAKFRDCLRTFGEGGVVGHYTRIGHVIRTIMQEYTDEYQTAKAVGNAILAEHPSRERPLIELDQ